MSGLTGEDSPYTIGFGADDFSKELVDHETVLIHDGLSEKDGLVIRFDNTHISFSFPSESGLCMMVPRSAQLTFETYEGPQTPFIRFQVNPGTQVFYTNKRTALNSFFVSETDNLPPVPVSRECYSAFHGVSDLKTLTRLIKTLNPQRH